MKKSLLFLFFCACLGIASNAQTTILDFESEETSTTFQYFGNFVEGILTTVIDNPDMSGINTSAKVSDFVKIANSEPWAGAYANPVTMPINVAAGNEVCIKVWSPKAGSLSMKLEGGTLDNWITTQDITEVGTWTNLCFDTAEPSIEEPFAAAAGGVFNQLVLFFDFQEVLTEETTYYFDDVVVGEGNLEPADVTFSVDMSGYSGSFDNVYVSGTFNDWNEASNPLTDDDGDGVYTTTVADLPAGAIEYKYQVNQWADQEMFNGGFDCTVTDPSGEFTNRSLFVVSDVVLDPVCWNSCYACGEGILITINLGAQAIAVSEEGLYIAGGGNWGAPGDNRLTDEDGDGVYSATFEKQAGFESFYTFTNGACGDFSCKENIAGQACSDPDNFDDRFMGPFTENSEINTCFGVCTDNTDCASGGATEVTFSVDMNNYTGTYETVYVAGSFAGWFGDANPMSDDDGDGIYTITVDILPSLIEYKFELDNWAVAEEFMDGDECTITDPSGTFVNRSLEVSGSTLDVCFVWNTCTSCLVGVSDLEAADDLFNVMPTIISTNARVLFNESYTSAKEIILFNGIGQIAEIINLNSGVQEYNLDVTNLENGIYYINIQTEGTQQTQRFVVNK